MIKRAGVFFFGALLAGALFLRCIAAPSTTGKDASLVDALRFATENSPTYFERIRAGKSGSGSRVQQYHLAPAAEKFCPKCFILEDEFATAKYPETWVMTFDWRVPAKGTTAATAAMIEKTFSPVLKGYRVTRGTKGDDAWLDWEGSGRTFVYAITYESSHGRGIEVRVGRELAKSVNVVKFSRGLTPSQENAFRTALAHFVKLGVDNADVNFDALRGKQTDADYYYANVDFGEYLNTCNVSGVLFKQSDGANVSSKWIFSCDAPDIGGSRETLRSTIRSAIEAALPSSFHPAPSSELIDPNEMRWDNGESVSVIVDDPLPGEFATYDIEVYHFVPNQ